MTTLTKQIRPVATHYIVHTSLNVFFIVDDIRSILHMSNLSSKYKIGHLRIAVGVLTICTFNIYVTSAVKINSGSLLYLTDFLW